jgi:hypothetical protein
MSRRIRRTLLFAAAVGAMCGAHRAGFAAEPQEQQLAQALFDDGRRLMEEGRYSEACPKLAESQRLDPGGGTLLNLAICHEKEGKLATASNDFAEALSLAARDGRKDREAIARERIKAVEGRVPRITVIVRPSSELDGLEVKLDGLVLRRAAWGVATPVDPGSHVVEASATGHAPWSSTVPIDAAQKKTVDVPTLGPLAPLPVALGGVTPSGLTTEGGLGVRSPVVASGEAPEARGFSARPSTPRQSSPVFYAVLTATLLSAATSSVTGVMAIAADKEAKTGCLPDRGYCRDQGSADAADRATTTAWISTVTLGVAAAGFVALLVLPSRTSSSRAPLRGSASVLPGGGTLGLSGAF